MVGCMKEVRWNICDKASESNPVQRSRSLRWDDSTKRELQTRRNVLLLLYITEISWPLFSVFVYCTIFTFRFCTRVSTWFLCLFYFRIPASSLLTCGQVLPFFGMKVGRFISFLFLSFIWSVLFYCCSSSLLLILPEQFWVTKFNRCYSQRLEGH